MKNLWILLILVSSALIVNAEETVYIPGQKVKHNNNKIIIKSDAYDSEFGKPKYYDSMYYNYFLDVPEYNLFYKYPVFYMPAVRGKSK